MPLRRLCNTVLNVSPKLGNSGSYAHQLMELKLMFKGFPMCQLNWFSVVLNISDRYVQHSNLGRSRQMYHL